MDAVDRFRTFHDANPHVYRLFDRFTREVIDRGYKHHSARDIIHRIRWETTINDTDRDFKINDHHSPYYARLWMDANPEFVGFFETRKAAA